MEEKRSSTVWVVAALLWLLPALYLGSNLALVRPFAVMIPDGKQAGRYDLRHYSHGGAQAEALFWPLEQLDRRIRPTAWREPIFH